ncbi:hypothetical protein FS749_002009 [Ceratobasidium sp. UAMH 11750]|nr:hypothetical protein FS749_002009 [Ceratobasidium sp. UAMH 11750]
MDDIDLPDDPLLQRALDRSDRDVLTPPDEGGNPDQDSNGERTGRDANMDSGSASGANKRPRTDGDLDVSGTRSSGSSTSNQASLRQYAQGLVTLKKLNNNSVQELHRFSTASEPEREMMGFALGLEMRDTLSSVATAVVSSGIHPDLIKNIKNYTAAAFFSPRIRYYSAPRGSKRSSELQNLVLNMLQLTRVPHLPPSNDAAGEKKVLALAGSELTDYRSDVKTEMSKRKEGVAKTDIGSFTAHLTRNVRIKITKEHYGRIAFLSREWRLWNSRPLTDKKMAAMKYWEWVDKALERVRERTGTDAATVQSYFEAVLREDEKIFNKSAVNAPDPGERDEWQVRVEEATGRLPATV